jgi:hypothetical protein
MPLTTDSLFGVAELAFDSALAHANGSDTVRNLASVGLGRALLDRGRYDNAASVLASVPTAFVYNTDLQPYASGSGTTPNMYSFLFQYRSYTLLSVSDREGQTGLDFRSAHDPRVVIDSTLGPTSDGGTWYFPAKFEGPGQEYIPLASGIEARLVQAEAALHDGQIGTWANDLNALRATLGIPSLPADSTTAATAAMQVDVMFRERAFWLFGTGTRLGDLRRLIRQYGRDQSTVFPTGPYPGGNSPNLPSALPSYGTDVSLTLPGPTSGFPVTNPNYKGCLDHKA